MKTLTQHLTQYAAYHRDRRNILTHFIGIPMIVLSILILLARFQWTVTPLPLSLSLAHGLILLASAYYLILDIRFGLTMSILFVLMLWIGAYLASHSMSLWLGMALGLFILGWTLQFIGHYFERRKPAFLDDLSGLAIGPLFVVAEIAFLLGFRKALQSDIESVVGPVRNATPP